MAARIRKGDQVIVITGRDKGKRGEVFDVLVDKNRVRVRGINMIKRHVRPNQRQQGGIVEKEAAIHISNVAHIDPKSERPTRVGFCVISDGGKDRKIRIARRSGEQIDK